MTERTATTFRLSYRVAATLPCPPERAWARLTDAAGFPAWNTTVTEIKGDIALGAKLAIRVPASPDRTFSPTVTELDTNRRMVWADGFAPMFRGVREFSLTPGVDGTTDFVMTETFSGLMLPMIKSSLPDFCPIFDQYAADLVRAVST